jgi:hypothetical protein
MDPVILQKRKAVIATRAVIFVNFWIELCHANYQEVLSRGASYDSADHPTTSSFTTLFHHSPPEILVKVITDSFTDEACYLLGLSPEELEHFDPGSLRQLPRVSVKDSYWGVYIDLLKNARNGIMSTYVGSATRSATIGASLMSLGGLISRLWSYFVVGYGSKIFHGRLISNTDNQPSFHILADLRKHASKHRIYAHLVEAFGMTITPAFDEAYVPSDELLKWCPACVPAAVREVRAQMGVSCMSNFPGLNHALPLKQQVSRDARFSDPATARCHNPDANCPGRGTPEAPWRSITGSLWDLDQLICKNWLSNQVS